MENLILAITIISVIGSGITVIAAIVNFFNMKDVTGSNIWLYTIAIISVWHYSTFFGIFTLILFLLIHISIVVAKSIGKL